MMSFEVNEVLLFLSEWRSAKECKEKFGLSDVQGVNMLRWLLKANLIKCQKGYIEGYDVNDLDGRVYYYRRK